MKHIWIMLLVSALAVPAVGRTCKGGKCLSPAQRKAMMVKAMKARQATPIRATSAVQKINQQIIVLGRTNYGGRNTARIKSLQNQRNQMLKASLRGR